MRKKNIINNKIKDLFLNQKGMALLTTLIFVFILVTFAVALLTMTSNDTKLSTLQRDSTKAFYLAEAGIDKALWYLNTSVDSGGRGLDWRTSEYLEEFYPVGTTNYYEITVEDDTSASTYLDDPKYQVIITSRGVVSDGNKVYGSRKIEVEAQKSISPSSTLHYNYALAAESIITINGAITINGDIHANGSIGGSNNNPTINGEQTIGGDEAYPIIDFEYYKQLAMDNGTYFAEGSVLPSEFDIGGTINGIYFIDGDVEIKGNTILNIHNGAIFATGEITSHGNTVITHTKDETYDNPLALIAKGDITLGGRVTTEGVIQSEEDIKVGGTVDVLSGTIIGDNVVVNGNVSVTYDPDLQGEVVVGTGVEVYIKTSWKEAY